MAVDGKSKLGKLRQSKTPVILQQVLSSLDILRREKEKKKELCIVSDYDEKKEKVSYISGRFLYQNVWPILAEGMASSILIFENTSTCVCTPI